MLNNMKFLMGTTGLVVLLAASASQAVTIGFVEEFDTDVAGFEDTVNNPLTHVATGGADGGGFARTSFNYLGFVDPFGGGGPVTFRGSFADNPSGGAFIGDYLAAGVGGIRVSFRHNAPEPLNLFLRVTNQFNFPGVVIAQTLSVPANQWTEITFDTSPFNPLCNDAEGISCAGALSNVQTIQFGTDAPAGLLDDDVAYSLDIDRITILPVPEPGSALLMGLGLLGLGSVRRSGESA